MSEKPSLPLGGQHSFVREPKSTDVLLIRGPAAWPRYRTRDASIIHMVNNDGPIGAPSVAPMFLHRIERDGTGRPRIA